jgi:precorrin-6Y C5,15-methyltransferase (decarboxylating)
MSASVIEVIGIDDSGPSGVSAAELDLIERAQLLCGGRRHLDLFASANAERLTIGGDLEQLYVRLSSRPDRTVVLASGDPCFFGIGPLLVERFGRDHVSIHAHASSVGAAFARIGISHHDATVLSVHGRPIDAVLRPALRGNKVAFLTDPQNTPSCVAQALLEHGMSDCPAYVCERLGGAAERIVESSLVRLVDQDFDPVNVMILLPSTAAFPGFGRDECDYGSLRGQITKSEVRAVTLARLEPWDAEVCWDIGAASGSLAIEMDGQMRAGSVFAVERDEAQVAVMRDNLRRHRAGGVHVVHGEAPEVLDTLPDPDAVFVGGAGAALKEVLLECARRLRPGGRLVANFALLESVETWRSSSSSLGWPNDLSQISIARAEPLGSGTHLAPLAPVWITRIRKPGAET